MSVELSIIIPAYNEQRRIARTLESVLAYAHAKGRSFEVLVVDDGSEDATAQAVEAFGERVRLLRHEHNRGKGAAVRTGMLAARGAKRLFMDADGSTDIGQLEKLLPHLERGYGVVIGSRRVEGALIAKPQTAPRAFMGLVFRQIAELMLGLGIRDTQNGFKLFTADAAERIFSELSTEGWMFDAETLARARALGITAHEAPIIWKDHPESALKFSHAPRIMKDMLRLRRAYPPRSGRLLE